MKISANGISVNYTLDGPASAPVVTLSHSLATDLSMWEPQRKALTARPRVLRYDTRGHGGTDAPAGASRWTSSPRTPAPCCVPSASRGPTGSASPWAG